MLGTILPYLIDFFVDILKKEYVEVKIKFRNIVCIGLVALTAFISVLILHSYMRGNGDITNGLITIFREDILRRTIGGNASEFSNPIIQESINASIKDVIVKYLNFETQILVGINGNMFSTLLYSTIAILLYNIYNKKCDLQDTVLFILSLFTSLSWFILGKSHSYIHTHMNFICWYYYLIPVMFYIILKQIDGYIKGNRQKG